MNKVSTVVIGGSGFVGSYILKVLRKDRPVLGTYFSYELPGLQKLDITSPESLRFILDSVQAKLVICPAANPFVDGCERDPAATRRVNVEGLANLVREVRRVGARLVYFSSEYVFDGTRGPYSEDRETNPINEYGRQKLEAEQIIQRELEQYLIVRLSGPYGWELRGKNFVVNLLKTLRKNEVARVPYDQIITPTYVKNFARAIAELVDKSRTGIYHVAGSQPMIRTEFAKLVAAVFGFPTSLIHPVATAELHLAAPRPHSAGLDTSKAQAVLSFPLVAPEEGLAAMRDEEAQMMGAPHAS